MDMRSRRHNRKARLVALLKGAPSRNKRMAGRRNSAGVMGKTGRAARRLRRWMDRKEEREALVGYEPPPSA